MQIAIAAPVARVFALIDDPRELARWQPVPTEILFDAAAPRGPGARYVIRTHWGGKAWDMPSETVARREPEHLAVRSLVAGRWVTTEWTLTWTGAATMARCRTYTERPAGLLGLWSRLLEPKENALALPGAREGLERLKRVAEAAHSASK